MNPTEIKESVSPEIEAKHAELRRILGRYSKVLVAFSGGVDSTLILKVATDTLGRERAFGVIAKSETLTSDEFDAAVRLAAGQGFNLRTVSYSELDIENYSSNPPNRCYFCKSELFERLAELAREVGAEVLCNGDNFDDVGDFRPGMRAAAEANVVSPLKEARMTKAEVRALALALGLPNWDKPSGACLSSRIPYGQEITKEKLDMVGRGEKLLRDLGFRQVRLRHHGPIARIEVGPSEIERMLDPATRATIARELKSCGFAYVALDLEGYRTGSLNETLGREQR
ncbi:MAG: ATP-dependent sacrificial sulfur transferase LarE [Candidatus Sumerlaeota bacterium]|nr:ATP-dependent sacrificial sulfur transferase LarE [Candidatus Sumerlaeota bacterium]